jgi:hypothetical protein
MVCKGTRGKRKQFWNLDSVLGTHRIVRYRNSKNGMKLGYLLMNIR